MPLQPKTSDEGYLKVVNEIFNPIAEEFDPDVMALQAGQDNHFTDPITSLNLTARGYADMMNIAVNTAKEICDNKIISILGGGYGIEGGLPYTNLAVIASLAGLDTKSIREPKNYRKPDSETNLNEIENTIRKIKDTQRDYWKL